MLRRLKKFTVYSSVIVVGKASRALDNAPFAGQDEPEDAKGLLRRLSECDDDEVHIFGDCYDLDTTRLRIPPASPTPAARRATVPRRRRYLDDKEIKGTIPPEIGLLTALTVCLLYTSPSPRDATLSRMPSSA